MKKIFLRLGVVLTLYLTHMSFNMAFATCYVYNGSGYKHPSSAINTVGVVTVGVKTAYTQRPYSPDTWSFECDTPQTLEPGTSRGDNWQTFFDEATRWLREQSKNPYTEISTTLFARIWEEGRLKSSCLFNFQFTTLASRGCGKVEILPNVRYTLDYADVSRWEMVIYAMQVGTGGVSLGTGIGVANFPGVTTLYSSQDFQVLFNAIIPQIDYGLGCGLQDYYPYRFKVTTNTGTVDFGNISKRDIDSGRVYNQKFSVFIDRIENNLCDPRTLTPRLTFVSPDADVDGNLSVDDRGMIIRIAVDGSNVPVKVNQPIQLQQTRGAITLQSNFTASLRRDPSKPGVKAGPFSKNVELQITYR